MDLLGRLAIIGDGATRCTADVIMDVLALELRAAAAAAAAAPAAAVGLQHYTMMHHVMGNGRRKPPANEAHVCQY